MKRQGITILVFLMDRKKFTTTLRKLYNEIKIAKSPIKDAIFR